MSPRGHAQDTGALPPSCGGIPASAGSQFHRLKVTSRTKAHRLGFLHEKGAECLQMKRDAGLPLSFTQP